MKLIGYFPQLRNYCRENTQHNIIMMRPCMEKNRIRFLLQASLHLLLCRFNDFHDPIHAQVWNHWAVLIIFKVFNDQLMGIFIDPLAKIKNRPLRLLKCPFALPVIFLNTVMQLYGCSFSNIETGIFLVLQDCGRVQVVRALLKCILNNQRFRITGSKDH